jgi:reductive dehalogenase
MGRHPELPDILSGKKTLAPFPHDKIRRADKITTDIVGDIRRIDLLNTGFAMAATGRMGPAAQKEWPRFLHKFPLGAAIINEVGPVFKKIRDGKVFPATAPIPDDLKVISAHIKALGYFLKAQAVAICEMPEWAFYTHVDQSDHVNCKHKYAIVLISEWDYETMLGSTGDDFISSSESFVSYNASAHMACTMAAYLRRMGYPARANFQNGPLPAYDMIVTPLLVLSGLCELSRAGWALNPHLGGRFKVSVVTTDLPLEPDKPVDFGLQAFCRTCKKCADHCPSRAISAADDKSEHNGYMSWPIDFELCTKYRIMNQNGAGCCVCIKVCPWNKPRGLTHDLVRWTIQNLPVFNPLMVKLDDLFGYGKQDTDYKWWFDFEVKDDSIQNARRSKDNLFWQQK